MEYRHTIQVATYNKVSRSDVPDIDGHMNKMGQDNWELVNAAIIRTSGYDFERDKYTFFWKRQK